MARLESTDTKIIKYLDKAIATHERAKDLTHQLITFSKGGIPIKKTGDIGEVLKDCAEFALTGSNVLSRINIDKNLMLCDFDRNQMSQVFDNILINAKQSMPEGGVVTITASNVMIQPDTKPTNDDDLQNTEFIKISIIDSGIGIDKDNLKKIFDPFFTTKLQGTGLGLASSYSIIKNHNGKIEIESEKGKGAAFHIFIPASKNKQLTENIINTISHTGIGKIVIMDDEDFILDIVSEMLKYMGYESEFVKDGDSLLTLITKYHTENISILGVILDLTIPGGKGGKDVIQDIRKLYPNLPVFASSGYSEDPIISKPEDYGFTDSIRKPFLVNELAGMLNKYFKPV